MKLLICVDKQLDFDLKWQKNKAEPIATEKKDILLLVLEHREELLKEWEAKVIVKEIME